MIIFSLVQTNIPPPPPPPILPPRAIRTFLGRGVACRRERAVVVARLLPVLLPALPCLLRPEAELAQRGQDGVLAFLPRCHVNVASKRLFVIHIHRDRLTWAARHTGIIVSARQHILPRRLLFSFVFDPFRSVCPPAFSFRCVNIAVLDLRFFFPLLVTLPSSLSCPLSCSLRTSSPSHLHRPPGGGQPLLLFLLLLLSLLLPS